MNPEIEGKTAIEILEEEKAMREEGQINYLKKKYKKLREKDPKTPTEDLNGFIFDEGEIIQKRVFTSHLIDKNVFGFGLLLPKYEEVLSKKGELVAQEQVWKPVVVTSDRRGLVVSKYMENEFKIAYEAIPHEMNLKWDLFSVDKFLHDEEWTTIEGIDLFNNIQKEYQYYCFYRSSEWYDINPLWDIGTYLNQLFSAFPIKEERGLKATAKTKTMSISSNIALNSTDIMVNPSEATLFRVTEELRPTKFIDEAEKLFKITKQGLEADNRVELINASYTRNGVVPRQEKLGNKFITRWYHVYSPTRVASINGLFGATEDRAITQIHTKAPDNDARGERDVEEDKNSPKWNALRNQCYLWTLRNWKKVLDEYSNFKVETTLKKRDLQIWKPILVLAKVIDVDLLKRVLSFAEKLAQQKKNDNISEGTLDYKLLDVANSILVKGVDKVYVNEIYEVYGERYGADHTPAHKTISTHLDKIGFKELRDKDRAGSHYLLTKEIFDEIISPITSNFSSQSSHSSQLSVNSNKISDECVMNNDKCDESYDNNNKIIETTPKNDSEDSSQDLSVNVMNTTNTTNIRTFGLEEEIPKKKFTLKKIMDEGHDLKEALELMKVQNQESN